MFKMSSFVDEVIKLSGVAGDAASGVAKHWKGLGALAVGATGALTLQQAAKDRALGALVRKQQEGRG